MEDNKIQTKKLTLKNDVLFQMFFAKKGNEQYLIDFLTGLLKIEIKEIIIQNEVTLEKIALQQKSGRLDILAKLEDGTNINIEMQVADRKDMVKRSLFYGSKILGMQTVKGTDYQKINQVIMINILDYKMEELKEYENEYIAETVMVLEKHREQEIEQLLKMYFIELPKYRKQNPDMDNKLNQWLAFIDSTDERRVKMAEEKNEIIKTALNEVEDLMGDEELKILALQREIAEMDRISDLNAAREEGIEKGKKEGAKEAKKETAKKMLEKNIPIETIIEITGLTKQEIMSCKLKH